MGLGEERFADGFGQETLMMNPLDGALRIHQQGAEVRSGIEAQARVDKLVRVFADCFGGVLGNQAEEIFFPGAIGIVNDDNAGAQALAGRMAKGETAQVNGRHRRTGIIENTSETFGGAWQLFQSDERQNLDDVAGLEGVAVVAELEKEKK